MKLLKTTMILLALGVMTLSGASRAADPVDLGKTQYLANCAVCHGPLGKGNGPLAGLINTTVADFTGLSKQNGGVFPVLRIYAALDGTHMSEGHGTRDMPIWGNVYKVKAAEYYSDAPYDQEAFVRGRLLVLIEYLNRLQAS